MDSAKKAQDEKNYYSGTAQHWIDNIASDFCNKKEFVFADVLLYNYAFFGANYGDNWPWFPITYVYDGEYGTILQNTACQMKSKEVALRWANVFGFDTEIAFHDNVKSIMEMQDSQRHRRSGYPMSFIDPQLLSDFIKPEEIATMR